MPPTPKRCGCGQISQPLQILQFPHLSGWVITPWPSCLQGLLQGRRMLKTQSSSQVLAIVPSNCFSLLSVLLSFPFLLGLQVSIDFMANLEGSARLVDTVRSHCASWTSPRAAERPLRIFLPANPFLAFPGGLEGKEFTCNAGDLGLIPRLGRSPGEGNGYPLQ